ncbi:MAG: PhoH family protein [Actinomycetota bacterium]
MGAQPDSTQAVATYVLDTSVLLSDPSALFQFEENRVVIPLVVLTELEAKRHHPDLGWAARHALRSLEAIRIEHGRIDEPAVINDRGGSIRVELNHVHLDSMPEAFRDGTNDERILSVAKNLADAGEHAVLVTRDLPMRLRASVLGLAADEYRTEFASDPGWTGVVDFAVEPADIDRLYADGELKLEEALEAPVHTAFRLTAGQQSAIGRMHTDRLIRPLSTMSLFGIRGRNAEQRIALDLLADPSIGIVSLGGPAGTGKSVLALAAALESVVERQAQEKVLVFRPLFAVGGQDLGYLPGDESEKMAPWAAAVYDALGAICSAEVRREIEARELLEVLPLTHIRGRSLNDAFVIIDEAQNLERGVLLTALSRLGENSRVVLTHDIAQRDNLRVGNHDGVVSVIDALRGQELFAHVALRKAERSAIAALVTELLDDSHTRNLR